MLYNVQVVSNLGKWASRCSFPQVEEMSSLQTAPLVPPWAGLWQWEIQSRIYFLELINRQQKFSHFRQTRWFDPGFPHHIVTLCFFWLKNQSIHVSWLLGQISCVPGTSLVLNVIKIKPWIEFMSSVDVLIQCAALSSIVLQFDSTAFNFDFDFIALSYYLFTGNIL